MNAERWQRIKSIVADAMEREAETRAAFIAERCGSDAEVRREVDRLLAAHEGHDTLLDAGIAYAIDHPTATTGTGVPATTTWTSRLGRWIFPEPGYAGRFAAAARDRGGARLRTLALLYATGFVVAYGVYELIVHGVGGASYIQAPHTPGQIIASCFVVMALAVFWAASKAKDSPERLVHLGLVFEVFASLGIALVSYSWTPQSPVWGVSWICVWITVYPLVVPAPPHLAALAAFTSAAMGPVALALWVGIGHAKLPSWEVIVATTAPNFACAFLAWVGAQTIHRMQLELRRLGSYRLVSLIGRGGMGEVWIAEHDLLARPAALKLVRSDLRRGRRNRVDLTERLEREAQSTAGLSSPHTVNLYDFGITEEGVLYYVMELLEGFDLETLVRRFGPVPPNRAVHFLRQVCASLAEAHSRDLVHRDIKPSNVFVCRQGLEWDFIKVLDFGIVRQRSDPSSNDGPAKVEHRVEGSPGFMAPESLRHGTSNPRTDLYSLGRVGVWLLTGETARDPLSSDIPHELADALAACLEDDPERRPESADAFAVRLAAIPLAPWDQEMAARWWPEHAPATAAVTSRPTTTTRAHSLRA